MFPQVLEVSKQLLLSPALQTQLDAISQDFQGFTLQARDLLGNRVILTIQAPLTLAPFNSVEIGEPPRRQPGGYPKAYVYHIISEYPKEDQEDQIRLGLHRCGVTIFGSGKTPEEAEQIAGRMAYATQRCLEGNQYIYGQLPRAYGNSTLVFPDTMVSGQHLASTVVPVHFIFIAKIRELR